MSYDPRVGGNGGVAAVAFVSLGCVAACGGFLGFGEDDPVVVEPPREAPAIDAGSDALVVFDASGSVEASAPALLPRTATFEMGSLTGPGGADETVGFVLAGADGTSGALRGTSSAKTETDSAVKRAMFFDLSTAPAPRLSVSTLVRADMLVATGALAAPLEFIALRTADAGSFVSLGVSTNDNHVFLMSAPGTPQDIGVIMSVNGRYRVDLKVDASSMAVEVSIEADAPDPVTMQPLKQTWSKALPIAKVELGAHGTTAFTYDDVALTGDPWTP